MTEEEIVFLESEINHQTNGTTGESKLWSAIHQMVADGDSIVECPCDAGAQVRMDQDVRRDLSGRRSSRSSRRRDTGDDFAAAGGFGRKWQANRRSRGEL